MCGGTCVVKVFHEALPLEVDQLEQLRPHVVANLPAERRLAWLLQTSPPLPFGILNLNTGKILSNDISLV